MIYILCCCCISLVLATQIAILFQFQVKVLMLSSSSTVGDASSWDEHIQKHKQPEYYNSSMVVPTTTTTTTTTVQQVLAKPMQKTQIRCETTRLGDFVVQLRPDLAPHGVERIQDMVDVGFFNQGIAFFRVNSWLTQFGADQMPHHRRGGTAGADPYASVGSDPKKDVHPDLVAVANNNNNNSTTTWTATSKIIKSSSKSKSLTPWVRGTFALIGQTQMVVVIRPNPHMGTQPHDAPAGFVTMGMDTVFDQLYRYNDLIDNPKGDPGPRQEKIFEEGIEYIYREFPKTDVIKKCYFL
jgi:cyclophilin family peptidyl-prolyl cis-trans isomerase